MFFDNQPQVPTDSNLHTFFMPHADAFKLDRPSSCELPYLSDAKRFSLHGMKKRNLFIRWAEPGEFDLQCSPAFLPPALWLQVSRLSGGWHLRLPFWRGDRPFLSEPASDAAVAAVVAECIAYGGFDRVAMDRWYAAVQQYGSARRP